MTSSQRIHFFVDLWRPACAIQGWDANDRELRLSTLSDWLGREITSLEDVGGTAEFTEVKSRCLALFKPADVDAQLRQTQAAQKRLQLRWKVNVEAVKLLSAFMDGVNQWAREGQAMRYIEAILRDRFKRREELEQAVDALSDRDLGQLVFTLARTIDAKRRKAGWTEADLRWRAGLHETRSAECGVRNEEGEAVAMEDGGSKMAEAAAVAAGAVNDNEPF